MEYERPSALEPFVSAMQGASGLSEFDAITSVLFAVTTHLDLEKYPILVYLGVAGSGKSAAMKQLFPMCKGPTWIHGNTLATQRNALDGVRTAFLEEGDRVDDLQLTDLYTKRYSRQTGFVEVNVARTKGGGYELQKQDVFGATVMHRRMSLADVALRSRAIIIRTKYQYGEYGFTKLGDVSAIAATVATKVTSRIADMGELDRVQDTWNGPYLVAEQLGMRDWTKKAMDVIEAEAEALKGGQGYEPGEAILQAIDILSQSETGKREDRSIRVSEVVQIVKEQFALTIKPNVVKEEAEAKGFQTGLSKGYRVIKVKKELLDELLPEAG